MVNKTFLHLVANDTNLRKTLLRFMALYLLLVAIVFATAYSYFQRQEKIIVREAKNTLSIISELKGGQITNWRRERFSDAFTLSPVFIDAGKLSRLTETRDRIKRQEMFSQWTSDFLKNPEYEGASVYGPALEEITSLDSGGKTQPLSASVALQALQALKEKRIVFSDMYRNEFDHTIDLDIYIPVQTIDTPETRAVGLIVLKIYPEKFLYPFMQANLGMNTTGETYIIRKEGDKAFFLNNLKYLKDSALSLNDSPFSGKQCEAMAVRGVRGIVECDDYRGVSVIASVTDIPDSSWILIVKMDREEVNAFVNRRVMAVSLIVLFFLGLIGASLAFVWYRQIASFYQKQYAAEAEHRTLTRKYDYLIKFANDIIIMFNKDLKVIEANDKALGAYAYSLPEITKKNLKDLQSAEAIPDLTASLDVVAQKGNILFTTTHKRKDGTIFPVEISLQHFIIEWNEFYQAIIRDLSGRA